MHRRIEQPSRAALLAAALLLAAGCAGTQKPASQEEGQAEAAGGPVRPAAATVAEAMTRKATRAPTGDADRRQARQLFAQAVARSSTDREEAAALFESAFRLDPDLGYAAYDAGVLYERSGDLLRARDAYFRALKVNPDFEPASQNLTRLRLRAGQAAEAESDLRARIAQYPSSLALRNQLVEVLLATDRIDGAEQESRKVLKTDEHNIPAMVNLAIAYYARKRYELARMVLENARQVAPGEAIIWTKLAFTEIALGNKAQAIEDFKKAAELRPDYPEAQINYGAMLVETEDYANAVKHLELAVQYAPSSSQAHLNLGNAYRGAKEFDKAQREYERALYLDPRLVDAYYDLGVLYLDGDKPGLPATERLERAIAHFDKFAASGGKDPRLAQYKKDAASLLEKERKRLAREEKEKLRKAAEARKKEDARMAAEAAARRKAEEEAARRAARQPRSEAPVSPTVPAAPSATPTDAASPVPPPPPTGPEGVKLGKDGEDR